MISSIGFLRHRSLPSGTYLPCGTEDFVLSARNLALHILDIFGSSPHPVDQPLPTSTPTYTYFLHTLQLLEHHYLPPFFRRQRRIHAIAGFKTQAAVEDRKLYQ